MVAFGSIKIFIPSLSIFSKSLKFDESAKSSLYEYPLHPDLSIPIIKQSGYLFDNFLVLVPIPQPESNIIFLLVAFDIACSYAILLCFEIGFL